jgi:hypothetical protein
MQPPELVLYALEIHRHHRSGEYYPVSSGKRPRKLIQFSSHSLIFMKDSRRVFLNGLLHEQERTAEEKRLSKTQVMMCRDSKYGIYLGQTK